MLRAAIAATWLAFAGLTGLAAAAADAPADTSAAIVRERLRLAPVLAGEFEQTKTLQGFRHPLVSRGEFLVARGQGVWWHTVQPFESTLVVTKTRLFTRAADGSTTSLVDAQAEPGLRQVNELIFSLLGGDLDALAARFDVQARAQGAGGWSATLVPRDPDIAKFLARATLAGGRSVETVRIEEARGDVTQIRFSKQAPASALSASEAARFR